MKTLWTFGDSFTYCSGYNIKTEVGLLPKEIKDKFKSLTTQQQLSVVLEYLPNLESYRELLNIEGVEMWPEIIAQNTGMVQIKNLGSPGASNLSIIDTLSENLSEIKRGDIVVVGTTRGDRLDVPTGGFDKTGSRRVTPTSGLDLAFGYKDSQSTIDYCDFKEFTQEQYDILVDYRYSILTRGRAYDLERFYMNIIINIGKSIFNKGAQLYTWDSSLWTEFESIDKYTDRRVRDGHWSHNGFKDFATFILDSTNRGIFNLDKQEYVKYEKRVANLI
jgi:hypothetical protein